MLKLKKTLVLTLASALLLVMFSGCASTRSENGVSIKEESSYKFW